MIRVVLDTNVVVSSLLSTGSPKAVFDLALKPAFVWYVSEPIWRSTKKCLPILAFRLTCTTLGAR